MIPNRQIIENPFLTLKPELSFSFAFLARVRARTTKHFDINASQLYHLMFAHYYCENHLFYTIPALIKFTLVMSYVGYRNNNILRDKGFIREYLPVKLNYAPITADVDLRKRKRRKTGRLYVITPKGKQVMTYLMRCYNDIYKEIN